MSNNIIAGRGYFLDFNLQRQVRKQIEEKYARQMMAANFFRRIWLRLRMKWEVDREIEKQTQGSPRSLRKLYLG